MGGTTNGFLTNDCNRTGRAGVMIDIGNGKGLGASRTINLDHNNRDRNSEVKGNRNINSGPRFGNISNRDHPKSRVFKGSNRDHPRCSSQDNKLRFRDFKGNRNINSGPRFGNISNRDHSRSSVFKGNN
jgi:hypothetical protein